MITLPRTFKPTHQTAGLRGYPAIDVFGRPEGGDTVKADFTGVVHKLSGRDPAKGGSRGGAYGWSIYVRAPNGDDRYMTHFGTRRVKIGDRIVPGTILGTVCNSAVSGNPGTSHIHYGLKKAPVPEPVYDVRGPKGRLWVDGKPAKVVNEKWPGIVKRVGRVEIIAVDDSV